MEIFYEKKFFDTFLLYYNYLICSPLCEFLNFKETVR
jgi:hypothetical protein